MNARKFFRACTEKARNGVSIPVQMVRAADAAAFFSEVLMASDVERLMLAGISNGCEPGTLLYVFDSERDDEWLHVEVDCSALSAVPSLRAIWPISSWWEDELERTTAFRFATDQRLEGIRWQQ